MKKINELFGNEKIPELKKFLRLMKLTVFFILISVGCVLAGKTYSQTKTLTLHMENSTVKEVLAEIESQSEFRIMYSGKFVDVDREVSLDVKNQKIESVLNTLFAGTDVSYTVRDRFIVLITPELMVEGTLAVMQQRAVSGKVTDSNNQPLPGVTVVIKGTTQGTVTNADGNFSLTNIPEDATLVFSFVGMRTQEVVVGNRTSINVRMEEETIGIEEVVAIGYGTMKKSDLTGSSVSADIESFRESPNVSILQSMQGSVPGLTIGQTNQAGQEPSISIRGRSTLSGSTSPLIVVDGIIFDGRFSDINPHDVESAEILKDASSKAIYGAKAANGVIIVTTKKGKIGEKPTFHYSGSYAVSSPTIKTRLLNREEYLQKVRDLNWRDSYTAESGYTEINPAWNYTLSDMNLIVLEGIEAGNDFDWWNETTRQALISDHNLSVAGGTNRTTFFMSAGYTSQKGIIKNDDYSRSSIRLNFDTKITDWMTIGTNLTGAFTDFSGNSPNMSSIVWTTPTVLPWDENGDFIINPTGALNINPLLQETYDNLNIQNRFIGNFYGIIKIPWVKGLTYRVNFGNNMKYFKEYGSSIYEAGQTGQAYKNYAYLQEQTLDNILNYTSQFDKHSINATLVYGFRTAKYDNTYSEGKGFSDLTLSYNKLEVAEIQTISSSANDNSSLYQMMRIGYNYGGKYLLTTTLRRDGFSGFAANNKIALFPSVGLGWIISEEDFFKIPLVNYLKIRSSYGENGNTVSSYSSLATVSANESSKYVFGDGGSTSIGKSVASLANNDLKWEKTKGVNLGMDFSLLNNRLNGNIEYYNSTTKDLLWSRVIPQITGFGSVKTNIGELKNQGLEFYVGWMPVKEQSFSWDIGVSFSHNKNTVVSLLGEDNDGDGKEDDLVSSGLFIGEPIGSIYTYEVEGIWQVEDDIMEGFEHGTYKIVDQNEDGEITAADDRIMLGYSEPAYQFGIQNTINFETFTLRFFINSIQGGKNGYLGANHPKGVPDSKGNATNSNWFDFYDYWAPTRPNAKYQAPYGVAPVNAKKYFQRNFIRLQDISLSYSVPDVITNKWGIGNAKVYISGKNLLTLTKWDGWDPETGQGIDSRDAFPVMKSYALGLELSF